MIPFAATAGILLLAFSAVMAVNAYLTASSNQKANSFASQNYTYTDVDIHEPNGTHYTLNISNGSLYKTGGSSSDAKSAAVINPGGTDKKPVFIRAAVTTDIYDKDGVNITRSMTDILPVFSQGAVTGDATHHIPANASWSTEADAWTKVDTGSNLVYFYYNAIVVPGDETFNLFDSVTLSGDLTQIQCPCNGSRGDRNRRERQDSQKCAPGILFHNNHPNGIVVLCGAFLRKKPPVAPVCGISSRIRPTACGRLSDHRSFRTD